LYTLSTSASLLNFGRWDIPLLLTELDAFHPLVQYQSEPDTPFVLSRVGVLSSDHSSTP